jgi:CrcB protein
VTVLWVALAGGVGAGLRLLLDNAVRRHSDHRFPTGTLLVNITGSLLLGVLTGLVLFRGASDELGTVAGTGFCGGYTTFSAASFEVVRLAQRGRWSSCLLYATGSFLLSTLAAGAGLALTGA